MTVSNDRFDYLSSFLRKESGIVVNESKLYLIRSRLQPLANSHGYTSLDALIDAIKKNERGDLALQAIDQMTTNETLFFRDAYPFEVLKKHLFPKLLEKKPSFAKIKIWSAASSTGQEATSIAITAMEAIQNASSKVRIVGTDLSPAAIKYAKAAIYKQMEVQRGLPIQNLVKYFKQIDEHSWQVNDTLKSMIAFQEANLINPSLITKLRIHSPFDVVFCRNVLIYFDVEQRKEVIDQIAQLMEIGGYLFTGAGEMVEGKNSKWKMERLENRPVWCLAARN